jgi:hypothetical protein
MFRRGSVIGTGRRMRSQTLQLALIVALGAVVGLLIVRPWRASEPALPGVASEPAPVAPTSAPARTQAQADTPPTRTFNLPSIASARSVFEAKTKEAAAKTPTPPRILVPKDWLLRGSGPQNYDVRSDRNEVFAGQASVLLAAHDKDVANTLFASLMQTTAAAPWLGKRVEFSANVRPGERYREYEVWVRAIDAANVVIAYARGQAYARDFAWRKVAAVIDVPWSASEIAYGVSLRGPGKLNIDDTHLRVLDKSIPVPMRHWPSELGVVAQDASKNGPLGMPSNMDFEDVVPADEEFRELPKDRLDRSRF